MITGRFSRAAVFAAAVAGVALAGSQAPSALASAGATTATAATAATTATAAATTIATTTTTIATTTTTTAAAAARFYIVGRTPSSSLLNSVVAPSTSSQWAFGERELSTAMPPVALSRSGRRWNQATLPAAAKGAIVCAGATSASDVWAFEGEQYGPSGAETAAALQLRSGRWVIRHSFGDLFVTGCNVLSSTDVWVFGSTGAGPAIGTWHLHGRTWTHMTSSPASFLGQASVVSASNIWATGWNGLEGVLAHWNGSSWKADSSVLKALPKPSANVQVQIQSVTALSSASLWVEASVARYSSGSWHDSSEVVHWNGTSWQRVAASAYGYYLPAAVPDGHGGWWSAGYQSQAKAMTYVLHGTRGHWAKVGLPPAKSGYRLEVTAIANVSGARTAYAVANEVSKATGLGYGVILTFTY